MPQPSSFMQISWGKPVSVESLRASMALVPKDKGLYVFTNHVRPLSPAQGILYIGKTDRDPEGLRGRLRGYVQDPATVVVESAAPRDPSVPLWNSSLDHAGKAQLLTEIQQKYRKGNTDSHVYVRWHLDKKPSVLEPPLIGYLRPAFNSDFVRKGPVPKPAFFGGLKWSVPAAVEKLRDDPSLIPTDSGLYVFTNHKDPLLPGLGILYVGMTEGDAGGLRRRLSRYTIDPAEMELLSDRVSGQAHHSGKMLLLMEIQQKYRNDNKVSGVYVRWSVCQHPGDFEADLIRYLHPAFNTHFR